MKIVVAGHICLDIIPAWKRGGIKTLTPGALLEMEGIKFSTGGAVANTGFALQKLGENVDLIGKIGADHLGDIVCDIMQKNGKDQNQINKNMIVSAHENTSYSIILEPPNTDRIFLHSPGSNHSFTSANLPLDKIKEADHFHFGYPPLMRQMYIKGGQELIKLFKNVKKQGLITSLDMAMPDPNSEAGQVDWQYILQQVLPFVDVFLPSLQEIAYMLGYENYNNSANNVSINFIERIATELIDLGCNIVILKLGAQGLYLQTGNLASESYSPLSSIIDYKEWNKRRYLVPSFKVNVQGTTGAGDSSIAGFLSQLLKGKEPVTALKTAAGVGACCVESVNATEGIAQLAEVQSRIATGWSKNPVAINMKNWNYDHKLNVWTKL